MRYSLPPASFRQSNERKKYRNINLLTIAYAIRPQLRSRLTLGGRAFPRKPSSFGGRDSHPSFATHTGSLTSMRSTGPDGPASPPIERSPTIDILSVASVPCLAPVHFRRRATRLVSYYALFQGWLLLSQPPSCLSSPTSFST